MFQHITSNKHICVFNCKQKGQRNVYQSKGFHVIVALVTDSLFMVFMGKKLQCSLLPVEALQGDCGVIR